MNKNYVVELPVLIDLEPYCGDLQVFKEDVAYRVRNLFREPTYCSYFDKEVLSVDSLYQLYLVLKPYVIKIYGSRKNKKEG